MGKRKKQLEKQILERMEEIIEQKIEINNKYDNMIDELDFESRSYEDNVYNINEERHDELHYLKQQIPDYTFYIDGEEITTYDIFRSEDIPYIE